MIRYVKETLEIYACGKGAFEHFSPDWALAVEISTKYSFFSCNKIGHLKKNMESRH